MFRRVQDWVRSKKPGFGSNLRDRNKEKRDRPARPRSSTEGEIQAKTKIQTRAPDLLDEFKRNDLSGFDLVLVSDVGNDTKKQSPQEPIPYGQGDLNSSSTKKEEDNLRNLNDEPPLGSGSDESLVDLVNGDHGSPTGDARSPDLSLDEMETLDIFDSVVKDLEASDDGEKDDLNLDPESRVDEYDIVRNDLKTKYDKPIDYGQILGEDNGDYLLESAKNNNWQATDATAARKSFRFFSRDDLYLPSPEIKRRPVDPPELPPTDYPQSDDEYLDEDEGMLDDGRQAVDTSNVEGVHPSPSPKITSFSSRTTPPADTATCQGKAKDTGRDSPSLRTGAPDMAQEDFVPPLSISNLSGKNLSSTECSPRSLENGDGHITGQSATNSLPSKEKGPMPRITSFKSSSLPQKLSTRPVNDIVKKFESYQASQAF